LRQRSSVERREDSGTPVTSGQPGSDRRKYQRKVKPFYVSFSPDGTTYIPAYGLDMSEGGVGLLSQLHTPDGEFKLRIMLEGRDFTVTVRRRGESERMRDGKLWYATGVEFVTVEAEDRGFLDEFVRGLQIPEQNAVLTTLEATFDAPAPEPSVEENKRAATRKRKPFYIAFSINDLVYIPAFGLDISRDGMRTFTEAQMPDEPFKIRVILENRDFVVAVKKNWDRQSPEGKKPGWITGVRFVEITPIDREFVDCYANDKPFFAGNRLLEALERLKQEPERADLWLPPELLTAFLQMLVALKRLAPLSDRTYPLVRYHYEGARTRGEEIAHIVHVESRTTSRDGTKRFSTRFSFDQAGGNVHVV
jgi:hypothetical protein